MIEQDQPRIVVTISARQGVNAQLFSNAQELIDHAEFEHNLFYQQWTADKAQATFGDYVPPDLAEMLQQSERVTEVNFGRNANNGTLHDAKSGPNEYQAALLAIFGKGHTGVSLSVEQAYQFVSGESDPLPGCKKTDAARDAVASVLMELQQLKGAA